MNVNFSNENGICRICIDGEMTIDSVAQAKESLLRALASGNKIELNLAKVSEIDAAGLQLLVLAIREAADRKQPLHFVAHSRAVLAILNLCDLSGVLGDPLVILPA